MKLNFIIAYFFLIDAIISSKMESNSINRCGMNTECLDELSPVFRTLDPHALCGTDTSGHGNTTSLRTKIIHLEILKKQNITIKINSSFSNTINISTFNCSHHFTSCERSHRLSYRFTANGQYTFEHLVDDSYMILLNGKTTSPLCSFQYQFNVTTRHKNCTDREKCMINLCQENSPCADANKSLFIELDNKTRGSNCTLVRCSYNETCIYHNGNYLCTCPSGINETCSTSTDSCSANPCLNNGTCYNNPQNTNYNCSCPDGFTGRNCEKVIDYCADSPCKNNARCENNYRLGTFKCICLANYSGQYCEQRLIDPCLNSPCLQNQICITGKNNSFKCACPFAFTGAACDRFDCPCAANGRCKRDSISDPYRCECIKGYGGTYCEIYTGDCSSSISEECYERYLCTSTQYGYTCECPPHLEGKKCDRKFICSNRISPCQNGGYCRPLIGSTTSYKCYCPAGYTGLFCEIDINECLSKPCLNDGVCTEDEIDSYRCYCKPGFCGVNCAYKCRGGNATTATRLSSSQTQLLSSPNNYHTQTHAKSSIFFTRTSPLLLQSSSSIEPLLEKTISSYYHQTRSLSLTTAVQGASSTTLQTSTLMLNSASLFISEIKSTSVTFDFISSSISNSPSLIQILNLTEKTSILTQNASSPSTKSVATTHPCPEKPSTTEAPGTTPPTTQKALHELTCRDDPCNGYECRDEEMDGLLFRCACLYPTVGPVCTNDSTVTHPRFNGYSYVEFKPLKNAFVTMELSLHARSSNGVISYGYHTECKDFVRLSISNGHVSLQLKSDGQDISLRSLKPIVLEKFHTNEDCITFTVGDQHPISKTTTGYRSVMLTSAIYLGGLSSHLSKNETKFNGCIKEFILNGVLYTLNDSSKIQYWENISNCTASICQSGVCHNNATCTPANKTINDYVCNCQYGFEGRNCEKQMKPCQQNECNNGGKCLWFPDSHKCLCRYGRFGGSCLNESSITFPLYRNVANYSSYLEYPLQFTGKNALERFEIKLQFKMNNISDNSNALMVFMSYSTKLGSTGDDFFAVGIINNHMYLLYNLGSGFATIKSQKPISQARQWHTVFAGRVYQNGYLALDDQPMVYGRSTGIYTKLNVYSPLYIGGMPNFADMGNDIISYFNRGFSGTIVDVYIRTNTQQFVSLLTEKRKESAIKENGVLVEDGFNVGEVVFDCRLEPCQNNGTCVNDGNFYRCICKEPFEGLTCENTNRLCVEYNPCRYASKCVENGVAIKCHCPLGWNGEFCMKEINVTNPCFEKDSYMEVKRDKDIRFTTNIKLQFKSHNLKGLLFYAVQRTSSAKIGDFIALSIWQGYVHLQFNLGNLTAHARSRKMITIGQWHRVSVIRQGKEGVFQLDDNNFVGTRSSGQSNTLAVTSSFFIGGIPDQSYAEEINGDFQQQFFGSISNLEVNGRVYNLTSFNKDIIGQNIKDCSGPCLNHQCRNEGKCMAINSTNYSCLCQNGFYGDTCSQVTQAVSSSAFFSSNSYWFTRVQTLGLLDTYHLAITFRTGFDGLLFWNGRLNDPNSDFFALGIDNGHLKIVISIGGNESSNHFEGIYSDNLTHTFSIGRLSLTDSSLGKILRTDGFVYIGGLPDEVSKRTKGRFQKGFTGCITNVSLGNPDNVVNFGEKDNAKGLDIRYCKEPI